MQPETLLERIRNRYNGVSPEGREVDRLVESIIKNLDKILNHQQGSSLSASDLGLPDLNSTKFGDGLDNLRGFERVIEKCIRKYEPRSHDVHVSFVENERNAVALNFRINLSVEVDKQIIPVVFETVLGIDGRISVEKNAL